MAKVGRPSKYRPEFVEQTRKLSLLGLTDEQQAQYFEVDRATFMRWKAEKEDFRDANAQGKVIADSEVAASLFHRACGYSHPAVKFMVVNGVVETLEYTEHYPPDTLAATKWLFNRQRSRWSDKPVETAEDVTPDSVKVSVVDASIPDADAQ